MLDNACGSCQHGLNFVRFRGPRSYKPHPELWPGETSLQNIEYNARVLGFRAMYYRGFSLSHAKKDPTLMVHPYQPQDV